ncbi:Asp-tRNA(Asn)/Glu-tRNA(Gln) amidotransferase subunit GatC [Halorhodospira halochloris]|uniref:Aspartyl/glutamyl-tRNA(Asn/Gln) amidotransferase subunit C n=1 Tax=Halorhodospira halochloris TaxID=1052 RepID=A0A0X8X7J9_HALHR|nr:Asp-tRNA(Asn)/Glu-tRNA(Gln) amidotransferase subunit GatC [Halorhodospira halochloris]MBK1650999.1 Asp-tRNA(Asn)/Glu-tRNA(Gln) amidotransferase GatCAB subunit C [Halorhodospira halochloris]MCG5529366.1 Asp-tRNA(Asn)/Glu-tRNA(Gln) amidotransferase subunit GatC [Halorhodospira halochloris]MCG5547341.1 Asp-tRNA(Asn)/Glu-tRNA(Gln) amidotransferase subunit GatC [Halorhodospira halochloris]BAU56492.1 aspartyl-tRNA(Asn) amidotransferase subunit C [Halorhodospira halochloris]
MAIEAEEVKVIAHLARIGIEERNVTDYASSLSEILGFVEQMNSVDTTGVEPMSHPLDATQRLRPDEVTEDDRREHYQSGAPAVEAGLYLVPRVVE